MNWLEFDYIHINYFDKIVMFPESEESKNSRFISANQVDMSVKHDAQVLMMFTSLKVESEVATVNLPIVYEFLDVFSDDIGDFLLIAKSNLQ